MFLTVSWFTSLPENEAIWEQYRELAVELQLLDTPEAVANKRLGDWYEEHREECDKGAEVFWPEAYNPEEFRSAIHKGAHLMLEDRAAYLDPFVAAAEIGDPGLLLAGRLDDPLG